MPYRESILTRILKETLSGNANTALILNIGPEKKNIFESYYTLKFGQNASKVKKVLKENKTYSYNDLVSLIQKLKTDIAEKDIKLSNYEKIMQQNNISYENLLETHLVEEVPDWKCQDIDDKDFEFLHSEDFK